MLHSWIRFNNASANDLCFEFDLKDIRCKSFSMNNLLWISMIVNILVISRLITQRLFKKKDLKKREESYELNEFMLDLLSGDGLIRVSRVAPHDVLIKSPRNRI